MTNFITNAVAFYRDELTCDHTLLLHCFGIVMWEAIASFSIIIL